MTWCASILPEAAPDDVEENDALNVVEEPRTVALVGCTKTKYHPGEEETLPARELYQKSDYFSKTWELAGLVTENRWILSAKHGLVHPDDELAYYQTYIKDLSGEEYDDLVGDVSVGLGGLVGGAIPVGAEIVILGGKDYVQLVEDALAPGDAVGSQDKREWVHLSTPLQDRVEGGIGSQKSWLKDEIQRRKPTEQATLEGFAFAE